MFAAIFSPNQFARTLSVKPFRRASGFGESKQIEFQQNEGGEELAEQVCQSRWIFTSAAGANAQPLVQKIFLLDGLSVFICQCESQEIT